MRTDCRKYYDDAYFNRAISHGSGFKKYRISKILQIYTPCRQDRVLELGSETGGSAFALASLCDKVVGVDYIKRHVDFCKEKARSEGIKIKFVLADAQNTGLDSDSFDVVVCADLFEHLYPDVFLRVLAECKRLLRPGGRLVVWTPHAGHIFEMLNGKARASHVDYKSMDYLVRNLRENGFFIQKAYYTNSHVPVFRYFETVLAPVLPFMRRRIAILARKENLCTGS